MPYDFSVSPQPSLAAGQHRCDNHNERNADGDYVYIAEMITVDDFFLSWGDRYGRPIVNKTGITGPVAIRFVQPTHASGPDDEMALLVAAMKNQLGLELRPGKDPIEFFVIDHAERPDSAEAALGFVEAGPAIRLGRQRGQAEVRRRVDQAVREHAGRARRRNGGVGAAFLAGPRSSRLRRREELIHGAYVANGDARIRHPINAWPGLGRRRNPTGRSSFAADRTG